MRTTRLSRLAGTAELERGTNLYSIVLWAVFLEASLEDAVKSELCGDSLDEDSRSESYRVQ